jgi:hypothetical protein
MYQNHIENLLEGYNWIPRTLNSRKDFIAIECQEHGLYYKTVNDIEEGDIECPRCRFLSPSRMIEILQEAQREKEKDLQWLSFWRQNFRDEAYMNSGALYYRILLTHKETGYMFQKIGIIEDTEPSFDEQWNLYKWPDFKIETIDKIHGTLLEVNIMEALFQKYNSHLKITVPSYLKFNTNKTYEPNFIWQAKSKTVKPIRDAYANRQKNKCAICNKEINNPTLDHTHIKKVKGTGLIRNVLCSQCNTFLARVENNAARHSLQVSDLPDILRRMAEHLEDEKKIIHPTEALPRKKVGTREWNRVKKYYFKVYPKRKTLPKRPKYVNDSWQKMKDDVEDYIIDEYFAKQKKKKKSRKVTE